jgi:adenosine kinase
VLSQ